MTDFFIKSSPVAYPSPLRSAGPFPSLGERFFSWWKEDHKRDATLVDLTSAPGDKGESEGIDREKEELKGSVAHVLMCGPTYQESCLENALERAAEEKATAKKDWLVSTFLSLTVHALLVLILFEFMPRSSSPPPEQAPLMVSIVYVQPVQTSPVPLPGYNASLPDGGQERGGTVDKPGEGVPSPTHETSESETLTQKTPSLETLARPTPATPKKSAAPSAKPARKKTVAHEVPSKERALPDSSDYLITKDMPPRESEREKPAGEHEMGASGHDVANNSSAQEKIVGSGEGPLANMGDSNGNPQGGSEGGADMGISKGSLGHGGGRIAALPGPGNGGRGIGGRTLAIPKYEVNTPPPYPRVARMRGEEGTSLVRVHVLPDGTVGDVALAQSSGWDALDEAALRTVKTWRFVPGTQDGKPLAMWVQVPVTFRLK